MIGLDCFRYRAISSSISTISVPYKTVSDKTLRQIFMLKTIVRISLWLLFAYIIVMALTELVKGSR